MAMHCKKHTRGSVLQITLVLFMVFTSTIVVMSKIVIENARAIERIKWLHTARYIELKTVQHVRNLAKQEELETGTVQIDDSRMYYQVTTDNERYHVAVTLENMTFEYTYSFSLSIDKETSRIIDFTYSL